VLKYLSFVARSTFKPSPEKADVIREKWDDCGRKEIVGEMEEKGR